MEIIGACTEEEAEGARSWRGVVGDSVPDTGAEVCVGRVMLIMLVSVRMHNRNGEKHTNVHGG